MKLRRRKMGMRKVKKRDALRAALRSLLRLPELSESEKLVYAGLITLVMSVVFALILMMLTENVLWILLIVAGCLICLWFCEASEVMNEWEEMSLIKGLRKVEEK